MVDWVPAVISARTQMAGTSVSAPQVIISALIPITVLAMIVVILLLCWIRVHQILTEITSPLYVLVLQQAVCRE